MSFTPPNPAGNSGSAPSTNTSARVFKNPTGAQAQDDEQRRKRRLMLLWLIAGLLAAGTLGYGLMNRNKGISPGPVAAGGGVAPAGGGGLELGEPVVGGPAEQVRQVAAAAPRQARPTVKASQRKKEAPVREDRTASHKPPPSDLNEELAFDPPGAGDPQVFALLDEGNNDPLGGGGTPPGDGLGLDLVPDGDENFARRAGLPNPGSPGTIDGGSGSNPPVSNVPEPETYAMLLAGLAVIGWKARRRKPS